VPEQDSRDGEVQAQDEKRSFISVGVINQQMDMFDRHLVWRKARVRDLLKLEAPFCEMHFDAVKPLRLTAEEKTTMAEYLRRGGFILFMIDTYPYTQRQFWGVSQWPIMDFIQRQLPATDPDFSAGKASDGNHIFKVYFPTQTAESIIHELQGNPETPNRTILFYRRRLCCFVMGQYGYLSGDEWMPLERPYQPDYAPDPRSFRLTVNVFVYSLMDPYAVGVSQPDPSMPYQTKAPLDPFMDHRYAVPQFVPPTADPSH
jgi:hypothetical protein